jgi:hypothetical protein
MTELFRGGSFATITARKENIRGMLKQKRRQLLSGLFALVTLLVAFAAPVAAAGGNGLRVSPVRSDLIINPGESKTMYVSVTNVTAQPASLQAIVNDFTGNPDESGNPAIILNPAEYAPNHSLKRFVAPIGDFTLTPGQAKSIPVTINVPKNAAGGGYFGAVRFGPAGNNNSNQTVSLAGSVGSLILIKVPGDIKEQLTIASFDVRRKDNPSSFFTSTKNLTATIRFQNQGNIQEAPFGKILLKNRSGKILATYEMNNTSPPANVLPDSIRKFPIPLNSKKLARFGQYKLEGNFGYGTGGQLLSASTTFYVVPSSVIIGFAGVVALIAFIVFGVPRLVRAYNRRILRKAGRG